MAIVPKPPISEQDFLKALDKIVTTNSQYKPPSKVGQVLKPVGVVAKPVGKVLGVVAKPVLKPFVKPVLTALTTIDTPRRAVISAAREWVDLIDFDTTNDASFSDWYNQVKDPNYGFGTAFPVKGGIGRVAGFIGDVALDPLTYATFGGTIPLKATTAAGQSTRAVLGGIKNVTGRSGREALSGYANKRLIEMKASGVLDNGKPITDAFISKVTKDVAAKGKSKLPGFLADDIGIQGPGIYYFGSRVKVKGSGILGDFLERGLVSTRLALVSPRLKTPTGKILNPLARLHRAITPDMKFQLAHVEEGAVRAYRVGLANGTLNARETEQALTVLRGVDNQRRDTTKAKETFEQIVGPSVSDPKLKPHVDTIHRNIEGLLTPTEQLASQLDGTAELAQNLKNAMREVYERVRRFGPSSNIGDQGENYFPLMLSDPALLWDEGNGGAWSKNSIGIDGVSLDSRHRRASSFRSRSTQPGDWFWGHILESTDINVDRLNYLAQNPGSIPAPMNTPEAFLIPLAPKAKGVLGEPPKRYAKGLDFDLFEKNIESVMAKYVYHSSQEYGTAAFMRTLTEDARFMSMLNDMPLEAEAAAVIANRPPALMTNVVSILTTDVIAPIARTMDEVTSLFPDSFAKPISAAKPAVIDVATPPASAVPADVVGEPTLGNAVTKMKNVLEASVLAFDRAEALMRGMDEMLETASPYGISVYKILRQNFDDLQTETVRIKDVLAAVDVLPADQQLSSLVSVMARLPEFSRLTESAADTSLTLINPNPPELVKSVMLGLDEMLRSNYTDIQSFTRDSTELFKIQNFIPKVQPVHWIQRASYGSLPDSIKRNLDFSTVLRTVSDDGTFDLLMDDLFKSVQDVNPAARRMTDDEMEDVFNVTRIGDEDEVLTSSDVLAIHRNSLARMNWMEREYINIQERIFNLREGNRGAIGEPKQIRDSQPGADDKFYIRTSRFGKVGYIQYYNETIAKIEDFNIYMNVRKEFNELANRMNLNGLVLGDDFVDSLFMHHIQPYKQTYQADLNEVTELRQALQRIRSTVPETFKDSKSELTYLKTVLSPRELTFYDKYFGVESPFSFSLKIKNTQDFNLRRKEMISARDKIKKRLREIKKQPESRYGNKKQEIIQANQRELDRLERELESFFQTPFEISTLSKQWFRFVLGDTVSVADSSSSYLLNLESSYANRVEDMTLNVTRWRDKTSGPFGTGSDFVVNPDIFETSLTTEQFAKIEAIKSVKPKREIPSPSLAQRMQKMTRQQQKEYMAQRNIKVARVKELQKRKELFEQSFKVAQREFDDSNDVFRRVVDALAWETRTTKVGTLDYSGLKPAGKITKFNDLKSLDNSFAFNPSIINGTERVPGLLPRILNEVIGMPVGKYTSKTSKVLGEYFGATGENIKEYSFMFYDEFYRNNRDLIYFLNELGGRMTRRPEWQAAQSLDAVKTQADTLLTTEEGAELSRLFRDTKYSRFVLDDNPNLQSIAIAYDVATGTAQGFGRELITFGEAYKSVHELLYRKFIQGIERDWNLITSPMLDNIADLKKTRILLNTQTVAADIEFNKFTPDVFLRGEGIEPLPSSTVISKYIDDVNAMERDSFYPFAKNEAKKFLMKNFFAEFDVDKIDWSFGAGIKWNKANFYGLDFTDFKSNPEFVYLIFRKDIEDGLKFPEFDALVNKGVRDEIFGVKQAAYQSALKSRDYSRFKIIGEESRVGKPKLFPDYKEINSLNSPIYFTQGDNGVLALKAMEYGLIPGDGAKLPDLQNAYQVILSKPDVRAQVIERLQQKHAVREFGFGGPGGGGYSRGISDEDLIQQITKHLYETQPAARRLDAERLVGQQEVIKEWTKSKANKYLTEIAQLKKQLLEAHEALQMRDPLRAADAASTVVKQAEALRSGKSWFQKWNSKLSTRVDFRLAEIARAQERMTETASDGLVTKPAQRWIPEQRIPATFKMVKGKRVAVPARVYPGRYESVSPRKADYGFDDLSRPAQFEIIVDITPYTMETYNLRLRQQLGQGLDKGNSDIVQNVNRLMGERDMGLSGRPISGDDIGVPGEPGYQAGVRTFIEMGKKQSADINRKNIKSSTNVGADDLDAGGFGDETSRASIGELIEDVSGLQVSYESEYSLLKFGNLADKWEAMEELLDAGYKFRIVESPKWGETKKSLTEVGFPDALEGSLEQLNNAMFFVSIKKRFEDVERIRKYTRQIDAVLRSPMAGKTTAQLRKEIEILHLYNRLGIQSDYVPNRVTPMVRERLVRLNELEPMSKSQLIDAQGRRRAAGKPSNAFWDNINAERAAKDKQELADEAAEKLRRDERSYAGLSDVTARTLDEDFDFLGGDYESTLRDNKFRESIFEGDYQRDRGPAREFDNSETDRLAAEIENNEAVMSSRNFVDEDGNIVPFNEVYIDKGGDYRHNEKPVFWETTGTRRVVKSVSDLDSEATPMFVTAPRTPRPTTGVTISPLTFEYYQTQFVGELGLQDLPEPVLLSKTKFSPTNISDLPPSASSIDRIESVYSHLRFLRDSGQMDAGSPLLREIKDAIDILQEIRLQPRVDGKLAIHESLNVDFIEKSVENISSRHAVAQEPDLADLLATKVEVTDLLDSETIDKLKAADALRGEEKAQAKILSGFATFAADYVDADGVIVPAVGPTTVIPTTPAVAPSMIKVPLIVGGESVPTLPRMKAEMLEGWEYVDKKYFGNTIINNQKYVDSEFGKSMAEIWQNATYFENPQNLQNFIKVIGPYTKFFKAYIISTPGFQSRNIIANAVQYILAGGKFENFLPAHKAYINWIKAYNSGVTWNDYVKALPQQQSKHVIHARNSLAMSGGAIFGDVFHTVMKGNPISDNMVTRKMGKFAQDSDNVSRFALAYDSSMRGSLSEQMTAARIKKFYIDYEDVSILDEYMRLFMPFWIWTSRNFFVQLENIFLNPKPYQIYHSFVRNMSDKDKEDSLPKYAKSASGWGIPGVPLMAVPDLNFNRAKETGNQLLNARDGLGNITPLLKVPIEQIAGKRFYNDKEFEGAQDRLFAILKGLAPPVEMGTRLFGTEGDNQQNALLGFLGSPVKKIPYYEQGK